MATSTTAFAEFAREWGALLAHDSSTSLDHLFSAYVGVKEANDVTYSSSSGNDRSKSLFTSPVASVEDFTDVWAAAKRVNKEWEAACMVRSIRRSSDESITQNQLMLSMLCWAAALQQQEHRFFSEFLAQVREMIHHAALRCAAYANDEGAESIFEEVAFCVALELLGWHDSLLICLQRAMALPPPLHTEEDVLLFTQKVVQELASALSSRRSSSDSMTTITTRTSALGSSFGQEQFVHSPGAGTKEEATRLTVAVAGGDEGVVWTSLGQPLSKDDASSSSRSSVEHARAVGRSDTTTFILAPTPPFHQHH
ncbi:hypothetical protein MNV84_01660 [Leishmania braziliensis]|nr:hypothetical protein MNV84_01660 [Leishmania braziliensis]